ncbi:MAG: hypothetical protein LBQ93_10160 [Treponema sp.]|jgi:hypothetical protein|nr:hypothetical protein [Treponema sp.]
MLKSGFIELNIRKHQESIARQLTRGKTAYFALSWQNERGILGRWSDIKSTVIP